MMKGTPGGGTRGRVWARCMSLARSGLPVAVWAPETTQSLEPAKQPSQMGLRRVCWRARRAWGGAVVAGFLRGLSCPDGGSAVALARDAHISESRYGVPGFEGAPGIVGGDD